MKYQKLLNNVDKILTELEKNKVCKSENRVEYLKDLYHLNKLIYDFYRINTNSDLTKKEKIESISQLRTPLGKKLLSTELSEYAIDNFSNKLINHYDKIKKQQGGSPDKVLKKSELLKKFKPENMQLLKSNLDSVIKNNISLKNTGPIIDTMKTIIDWIFFPLWSLENTPVIGSFVEGPLDSIGILLDNTDIIMELLGPNITTLISGLLDVGQAIPAVGSAVSAAALPMTLLNEPIEHALTDGSDMIGMFLNLSRKQWGMAYISALSAIPMFADIVDSILTNLITANKYMDRVNKVMDGLEDKVEVIKNTFVQINSNINKFKPLASQLLNNPDLLSQPEEFLTRNLLSMKNRIDFLKDLSDKQIKDLINNFRPSIEKFKENPFIYLENPDKLYDELVLPYKNLIPKLKDVPDSKVKETMSGFLNIALTSINPILKQISNTQTQYIKE